MDTARIRTEADQSPADWNSGLQLRQDIPGIHEIAAQLASLAAGLAEISNSDSPGSGSKPISRQDNMVDLARQAKRAYLLRRKRDAIFGHSELFGEPAWDMLLDLYCARRHDEDISVSSACVASACPSTTALRWLGILQDTGLVARANDPQDKRRVLVHLTDAGIERMEAYLLAEAKASPRSG